MWSLLDALYIVATNNTTTAALNLVSTSFSLTTHGTLTFAADTGYTGDGSTGYLDTGYTPSTAGLNCTTTSCSIGAYILTSRSVDQSYIMMGAAHNSAEWLYFAPRQATTSFAYDINGLTFPTFTNSNVQGAWALSRNGSSILGDEYDAYLVYCSRGHPLRRRPHRFGSSVYGSLVRLSFTRAILHPLVVSNEMAGCNREAALILPHARLAKGSPPFSTGAKV